MSASRLRAMESGADNDPAVVGEDLGQAVESGQRERGSHLERSGGVAPGDVATLITAQQAIELDIAQAIAEVRELRQQVIDKIREETRRIVALASDRCRAIRLLGVGRGRHGQRQHGAQTGFQGRAEVAAARFDQGDAISIPGTSDHVGSSWLRLVAGWWPTIAV